MPPGRKSNAAIAQQAMQDQQRQNTADQPLQPDSAEIAHLIHLSADVIDALPPSLTRSLSDLKELDAVLNASLVSILVKLNKLHAMMTGPVDAFTPEQRLKLLKEVAEDANVFKLGGEDKIRVATGACETIIQHTSQLDLITAMMTTMMPPHLLENLPASTTPAGYPHLFPPYATSGVHSPRKQEFFPPAHAPSRQAAQAYSSAVSAVQAYQRETPNLAVPTPAARITKPHYTSNFGNLGRRKADPKPSQLDQGVSLPGSPAISSTSRRAVTEGKRPSIGNNADEVIPPKRVRKPVQTQEDKMDLDSISNSSKERADDPNTFVDRSANASPAPSITSNRGKKAKSTTATDKDGLSLSATASPANTATKRRGNNGGGRKAAPKRKSSTIMDDEEDGDFAGDAGVGPGYQEPGEADGAAHEVVEPASNDDPNEPKYCYCQKVSYGEMIGCDNDNCKNEWFHLGCIGLPAIPSGTWYCDTCAMEMAAPSKRRKVK